MFFFSRRDLLQWQWPVLPGHCQCHSIWHSLPEVEWSGTQWESTKGTAVLEVCFSREFLRVRQPNRSKRDEQGPGCLMLELTSVLQFHHISICKFPLPCQDAFSVTSGDWKALSRKALSCFAPLFFFFFFFNFVLIIIAGKTVLKY